MDVYLKDGELRLTLPPGRSARLFVDGLLQAEFGLGSSGPEDFRAELGKARAALTACSMMGGALAELLAQRIQPDHVVKAPKRPAAFAAGLELGLLGEYRVIGQDPMHSIKGSVVAPEHKLSGPSFARGWSLGCAIFAAIRMAAGEPDPRRAWGDEG